jgi:putative redox protein
MQSRYYGHILTNTLYKLTSMNYKFDKPIQGSIGKGKYQVTIQWRNGQFIADESISSGGQDKGPDPFTLLLSSLASCTLATLRMYIDRKGWDVPEITVGVNLFQQTREGELVSIIDKDIRFTQKLTDEQRAKLLEIADNCPISRLLKGSISLRNYIFNDSDTERKINYAGQDITVVWKPDYCRHSGRCVTQLPEVFNLNQHPWTNARGADTNRIIDQVNKCPTGALSYHYNQVKKPDSLQDPAAVPQDNPTKAE